MYKPVEKPTDNRSKAVANCIGQKPESGRQNVDFMDNRPRSIAQQTLQNSTSHNPNTLQLRANKQVQSSAQKHYNDGWGAKYSIQDDDSLKAKVPDSVRGDGTIDLGIYEFARYRNRQDGRLYKRGKKCTIIYKDVSEGVRQYRTTYTSIYHCGPSGPAIEKAV